MIKIFKKFDNSNNFFFHNPCLYFTVYENMLICSRLKRLPGYRRLNDITNVDDLL